MKETETNSTKSWGLSKSLSVAAPLSLPPSLSALLSQFALSQRASAMRDEGGGEAAELLL